MKKNPAGTIALLLLAASVCPAAPVTIGSLIYASDVGNGEQGFLVWNETGPDYCSAANDSPVCDILSFQATSLVVTFSDLSTATETPSGGFSFEPGIYTYGINPFDDPNQSFLFDPALNILSATFSGQVSPASFQIDDGNGGFASFDSSGTFSVTINPSVSQAVDITTDNQPQQGAPEPGTLAAGALIALIALRPRALQNLIAVVLPR